ncbi:MAG: Gfo/Idh/MocA family oxidoreductase [Candidatus Pacebacteria bacterium]|nr:Gfo/Idh/MocA family oxidoreductase [Candidatus Paceibacterota bacterium]
MTTRIGIIGCGGIAHSHLAGYQENGASITALADVNAEALGNLAAESGGAEMFDSAEALIRSGQVDAISICTPPDAHAEAALLALKKGIHVLCEKPLANTVEAAAQICEAADKSDAIFLTAFRHRILPAARKMHELVSGGAIGDVVLFRNTFCGPGQRLYDTWFAQKDISGGGTMMDTSAHSVDLFRFLCGEITEQCAAVHMHNEKIHVEDASMLLVKSESGAVGCLAASWCVAVGEAVVEVSGTDGKVVYDYTEPDCVRLKSGDKDWENVPVESSRGFAEETANFLAAIEGTVPPFCTAYDGLRAVEVIQACY